MVGGNAPAFFELPWPQECAVSPLGIILLVLLIVLPLRGTGGRQPRPVLGIRLRIWPRRSRPPWHHPDCPRCPLAHGPPIGSLAGIARAAFVQYAMMADNDAFSPSANSCQRGATARIFQLRDTSLDLHDGLTATPVFPLRANSGRVWTYMDPARLQRVWQRLVPRSQLLTYIRLPDAA
jgi:hypothetical protein